jgi:hypothetical protein
MYRAARLVHLVLASFCLPFLAMYGASAVQMSHGRFFDMRPRAVTEREVALTPGHTAGRAVAADIMRREATVRGELVAVEPTADGVALRIAVPGTVHEVRYQRERGTAKVTTTVDGVMGMLNRLHHAAGLWPRYAPLRTWGTMVAIVSVAFLFVGTSGLVMWFLRPAERRVGVVLLGVNLAVVLVLLALIRTA